jgi:hypothetical protein
MKNKDKIARAMALQNSEQLTEIINNGVGGADVADIKNQISTAVSKTGTSTTINSNSANITIVKIDGNVNVTKPNTSADISFDNIATINTPNNFNITSTDGTTTDTIPIPYELCKLPSGTMDTIEIVNGSLNLVKRVGKIVLNGNEGWSVRATYINTIKFNISTGLSPSATLDFNNTSTKTLCNKLNPKVADTSDEEHIQLRNTGTGLIIGINKSRLSTQDANGLKVFLNTNNITLYYELATPVYTLISSLTLKTFTSPTTITSTSNPLVNLTFTYNNYLLKSKKGAYAEITDDGAFHAQSVINTSWNKWLSQRYSYGFNTSQTPIFNTFSGVLESDTMISVGGGKGRWNYSFVNGGHVFEGWNGDETYRLTMLIGKQTAKMAEIFTFSPSLGYGTVRVGSDVANQGAEFNPDTIIHNVATTFKSSITLPSSPPASSTATGTTGMITWDSNYIYMCVATNTWKRVALSTW